MGNWIHILPYEGEKREMDVQTPGGLTGGLAGCLKRAADTG